MATKKAGKTKSPGTKKPENNISSPPAAAPPATLRNRIKGLRMIPARRINGAPWNWRTHGARQIDAVTASIEELGFFDPLDTRELIGDPNFDVQLVDGHCRLELIDSQIGPDTLIPCIVTDFTETESRKANLLKDPLAAMAGQDDAKLQELIASVKFEIPDLGDVVAEIGKLIDERTAPEPATAGSGIPAASKTDAEAADGQSAAAPGRTASTRYAVLIDCTDEMQQTELLDRFDQEGLKCRALVV